MLSKLKKDSNLYYLNIKLRGDKLFCLMNKVCDCEWLMSN